MKKKKPVVSAALWWQVLKDVLVDWIGESMTAVVQQLNLFVEAAQ